MKEHTASVSWAAICSVAWLLVLLAASPAPAQSLAKPTLLGLKFEQKLGSQLPLSLPFIDETGRHVRLGDYFGSRPVLLVLGYYECPMLCNLVLNGVVEGMQEIRGSPGRDFELVFLSINPEETPALAAAKKMTYLKRYGRADTEKGWHFLLGRAQEIQRVADAAGFHFAYDPTVKQYAHPSGVVVLTPQGKAAKYFFGATFEGKELNTAIKDAAGQRVGSPVRDLLILCFQHMPLVGEHSALLMAIVRATAVMTLLGLAICIVLGASRKSDPRSGGPPVSSTRRPAA